MPVWPKSLYSFGANLLTAGAEWRLRQTRSAAGAQKRTFEVLTRRLAGTKFWRDAGIVENMSYDSFQARVAPRSYEQLAPAIERMRRGESDVLWPGTCTFFATTPGTTGPAKCLPVTEELLAHFRRSSSDALLYYTVRMKHAAVFRGRHLYLGAPTALTPLTDVKPHDAYAGDITGIAALDIPPWVERHLYEPGPEIARMTDEAARFQAILQRTASLDITLLAGLPHGALPLAAALRERSAAGKQRATDLQGIWPNLECYVHGGVPLGPYRDELRAALGPTVHFHEIYPSSEAFLAAQDIEGGLGLRLIADTGIFYEFIPMADFDESRPEQLGRKVVPLVSVKTGVDYAVLVTTPAGLARYLLGDVVRFTSTEPPRLLYVGRTKLRLHAFGENVIEKEITDALVSVTQRRQWQLVNFHVAPLSTNSLTGQHHGRHEWWVELRPGTITTPTGPQMAVEVDAELQRTNADYAAKRRTGTLDAPIVRLVMPGVFEHWLRYQGKWGGQHKMPRCRSDRLIADELAQITNFARD